MRANKNHMMAFFYLGLSMFIVGSNIGIGKLILQEVLVFLFAAVRFLIASIVLAAGMFRTAVWERFNGATGRGLFMQSFFGCFLFSVFMLYGVTHRPWLMRESLPACFLR